MQRFIARYSTKHKNGAIAWAPGGPFDCLGPYAKIQNCPIYLVVTKNYSTKMLNTEKRLTCYAQGYADSFFSIPAATRCKGKVIKGYFTNDEDLGGVIFIACTNKELVLK